MDAQSHIQSFGIFSINQVLKYLYYVFGKLPGSFLVIILYPFVGLRSSIDKYIFFVRWGWYWSGGRWRQRSNNNSSQAVGSLAACAICPNFMSTFNMYCILLGGGWPAHLEPRCEHRPAVCFAGKLCIIVCPTDLTGKHRQAAENIFCLPCLAVDRSMKWWMPQSSEWQPVPYYTNYQILISFRNFYINSQIQPYHPLAGFYKLPNLAGAAPGGRQRIRNQFLFIPPPK